MKKKDKKPQDTIPWIPEEETRQGSIKSYKRYRNRNLWSYKDNNGLRHWISKILEGNNQEEKFIHSDKKIGCKKKWYECLFSFVRKRNKVADIQSSLSLDNIKNKIQSKK